MSIELNLGRDHQGEISYALDVINGRRFNNSFGSGDESWIVLDSDDKTAIFFPTPGANYLVSWETLPAFPSTPSAPMQEADIIQNPAAIQLENWIVHSSGELRLYVQSPLPQTMTILVYK